MIGGMDGATGSTGYDSALFGGRVGADMAVGQNQWYHFGVGASPILVYFSGDWDLTHGHMEANSIHIQLQWKASWFRRLRPPKLSPSQAEPNQRSLERRGVSS